MPLTEAMGKDHEDWTNQQVELRRSRSLKDVQDAYARAHEQVMAFSRRLPAELWRRVGTIPWYGAEYSLDDFIVYTNYAHKREHATGLRVFLRLHQAGPLS